MRSSRNRCQETKGVFGDYFDKNQKLYSHVKGWMTISGALKLRIPYRNEDDARSQNAVLHAVCSGLESKTI